MFAVLDSTGELVGLFLTEEAAEEARLMHIRLYASTSCYVTIHKVKSLLDLKEVMSVKTFQFVENGEDDENEEEDY